ncbi:glycosyltransferase involved in cell wall biosynthesis [Fontibacillus solani]|uniref:Glycosyltransferase involved in cell wall biosynthesis n=1 Tax=Fontibacillus solani TaxID=1572857 RepID=A0A7W3SV66_9BACL|nr:glycosyltransferase family 2 protein [Fontibacillus solani]MBA9086784.1 glycosyltransferase involved in cell wall biosynthesis [Fontibacillus solani]
MSEILLIIPAYNEAQNIANVIAEIKQDLSYVDILVVNDCSTDDTLQTLMLIEDIVVVSLPVNLGYSGALQTGFKYAVEKDYEIVIQFDGDGQHIASEAEKLINILKEQDVDIVIGSRFKTKNKYNHSFFRKIGTHFFSGIIKQICKVNITDPTSGFQVLKKSVFEKYAQMNNYPEYPDANLLIEMLLEKYSIAECQVEMRNREFGTSMHSGFIKPIKYMIKMFYAIIFILISKQRTISNY